MDLNAEGRSEEVELIRRARQGNAEAWEALVRTHQEALFRLAYLLLGNAGEAEDVAQEAILRAYASLERYDIERPLRPWLLSIAANLARNRRRSAGRYLAALRRWYKARPATAAGIEEQSLHNLERQELWHAIERLDFANQQVIYLRYFLEMSTVEVAETLQVPEGTVKSRLHRALKRLRGIIERDFPELDEGKTL
jgi:RNA polymerase sigma-70 factor (ECF subfamily)